MGRRLKNYLSYGEYPTRGYNEPASSSIRAAPYSTAI